MADYGLKRVPLPANARKDQLDNAYVRDLAVTEAHAKTAYVGSDHPLLYFEVH